MRFGFAFIIGLVMWAGLFADRSSAANSSDLTVKGNSDVQFYGFLRLDAIWADSQFDNSHFPSVVLSEDASGDVQPDQVNLAIHPRLTRIGMNYNAPTGNVSGKFEMDFQNGGSESRQAPRIRHAYLSYKADRIMFLAGQTWDLIAPLYPSANSDSLMWNAGNLGDRRPQIRLTWVDDPSSPSIQFDLAAGLQGAVSSTSGSLVDRASLSGRPNLQARFAVNMPSGGHVGFWGMNSRESVNSDINGETSFGSEAFGVDFKIPLTESVNFLGEAFTGRNLRDLRGGVGQGVNLSGQKISTVGGWVEVKWRYCDKHTYAVGFTLDDPKNSTLDSAGRSRNSTGYLAYRFNVTDAFTIGVDYIHWKTKYVGLDSGEANRLNLIWQYNY